MDTAQTSLDISLILNNLAYFNCKTGTSANICKQTVGYLKSEDTPTVYYSIDNPASTSNTVVSPTNSACSNTEGNGQLISSGQFCSNGVSNDWTTDSSATNIIIPSPVSGSVFKAYSSKAIVASISSNSIILNNLYDEKAGPNLIDKNSMKEYTSLQFATKFIDLKLFNCDSNGICVSNTGYITDGSDYYEIQSFSNNSNGKVEPLSTGDCSSNVGRIIKIEDESNGKIEFCINSKESIPFVESSEEKVDYIIDKNNKKMLVRAIHNIFSVGDITGTTLDSGLYGVIRDNGKAFSLPANTTVIEEGLSSLGLYDCDSSKGCKQTYGYLKSTDSNPVSGYYSVSIATTATNERIVPTDTSCSTVGALLNGDNLCININDSKNGGMINGKEYIIDASSGSIFNGSHQDSYVVVKATTNSFTLKTMEDGYQVNYKDGGNVVRPASTTDFNNESSREGVGIYQCEGKTNTCQLVAGYALTGSSIYTFTNDRSGASPYVAKEDSKLKCEDKSGEILKKSGKNYLCLKKELSVELSQDNAGNYVAVGTKGKNSPLTIEKMIKYYSSSTANTISYIVNDEYFKGKDQKNYVIKVGNEYYLYEFQEDGEVYKWKNDPSDEISAYKQLEEDYDNVYEDISPKLSAGDRIYLFYCESGECIESDGYMVIEDTSDIIHKYTKSKNWSKESSTNDCTAALLSTIKIDESQTPNKLNICLRNNDQGVERQLIDKSDNYMVQIKETVEYQKFVGNTEQTIIGKPDEKDGYYLVKGSSVVIKEVNTEPTDVIVHCVNAYCTGKRADSNDTGYYPDGNEKGIVHCEEKDDGSVECKLEEVSETSAYIDGGDPSKLIYCSVSDEDGSVKCTSIESHPEEGKPEYFVGGNGELITCTKSEGKTECSIKDSDLNGYFINTSNDANEDEKRIIKCENKKCEELSEDDLKPSQNKKIGDLIVDEDGNIKLQIKDSDTMDIKPEEGNKYQALPIRDNEFPGVQSEDSEKNVSIKIGTDGSIIYLEDNLLSNCNEDSACANDYYCINSDKIQVGIEGICTDINGSEHADLGNAGKAILYFDNKGNKYKEVNGEAVSETEENTYDQQKGDSNIMAYQCTFNAGDMLPQEKCVLVKGYLISDGKGSQGSQEEIVNRCNGWKKEGCVVVEEEDRGPCADGDEGRLGEEEDGKKVCFGKGLGVPVPTEEEEVRYIAFRANEVNEIYGKNKGEIVFLALTNKSVLVAEESEAVNQGVYLNWSAKEGFKDGIIYCGTENDIEQCKIMKGSGYYLDASSLFKEKGQTKKRKRAEETGIYNWLIYCGDRKCQMIAPDKGYYVNADTLDKGSLLLDHALIRCPDNTYCIPVDGEENQTFINHHNDTIIQCDSTSCSGENRNILGSKKIPTYFINYDEDHDDSTILIKCSGYTNQQGTCIATSVPARDNNNNNNIFLNGNLEDETKNEKGEKDRPLIICYEIDEAYQPTLNATQECETSEAKAEAVGIKSYYINSGDYIEGNKKLPLIECESSTKCIGKGATISGTEVFYINSNYGNEEKQDTKNYLIKCTSEEECAYYYYNDIDEGDNQDIRNNIEPEYYVHGGASGLSNAIIECEDEVNGFKECKLIDDAIEGNVYINSYNQEQIIVCYDESKGCVSEKNKSNDRTNEYYINTDPDSLGTSLIECSLKNGCRTVSREEIINNYENGDEVFINSNYKKADQKYQLINCVEGECELAESQATSEKPEYYFNSGDVDNSNVYRGDVIECTNSKSKIECKSITSNEGDVYLNAKYGKDGNQNQLIICEDGVCKETAVVYDEKDEYNYVNAGKETGGKLIRCNENESNGACTIKGTKDGDVFVDDNTGQLIVCDENGCNSKSTGASTDNNEYYLSGDDLIKCEVKDGEKVCKKVEPTPGADDGVFIDSSNPSQVIYCDGTSCETKKSTAETNKPQYFVNGDPDGELIECSKKGNKVTCKAVSGNDGDVYINGNYDKGTDENGKALGDPTNQIIKCNDGKCEAVTIDGKDGSSTNGSGGGGGGGEGEGSLYEIPQYYVNSGNENPNKLKDAIIVCKKSGEACELQNGKINDVYLNSDEETNDDKPLIKCEKLGCSISSSGATTDSDEHYLNAGESGSSSTNPPSSNPPSSNTSSKTGIIECSTNSSNDQVVCKVKNPDNTKEGIYINSNYSENGDIHPLITCNKEDGCKGMTVDSNETEYYVNGESNDLENAIIACTKKKCEKQTPMEVPTYYVGKDENGTNGLIECVETTGSNGSNGSNRKRMFTRGLVQRCTFKAAFTSEGYYLNNGYNRYTYPLILCDAMGGCSTVKAELGYYVNAGNPQKQIIVCEKENDVCYEKSSPTCPEATSATPGDYCYANKQLTFYNSKKAFTASKNQDVFVLASIPKNGFPGINSPSDALFRVSYYYINRYYKNGTIIVDNNGKVVNSLDGDQTDNTIITCNEVSKVCTESKECKPNTYLYDSENKRAIRCNEDGKMEYVDQDGFIVVDNDSDGKGKTKTPIIIYCEENGENCYIVNPGGNRDGNGNNGSKTIYYTNGSSLIKCINNVCEKVVNKPGNYIGYGEDGKLGIIHCNSNNECTFMEVHPGVKYLNDGADRNIYPLIECNLIDGCFVTQGEPGYYLTYSSSVLIFCRSSTTCFEVRPSEHYYFNAECTEDNNTIINCVEASNVISCSLEDALSGFYLTDEPDLLIHCRLNRRCKPIRVHNGVFRGALKGLVSPNRLYDRRDKEVESLFQNKLGMNKKYSENPEELFLEKEEESEKTMSSDEINTLEEEEEEKEKEKEKKEEDDYEIIMASSKETTSLEAEDEEYSEIRMASSKETASLEAEDEEYSEIRMASSREMTSLEAEDEEYSEITMEGIEEDEYSEITMASDESGREGEGEGEGEEGKIFNIREAEDVFGIIRCVDGQCRALTVKELAAVPICEFKHDQCYITQEYAMMKSATTSIGAGDFCTNSDHSMLYFATDTIIVLPKVIAGKTATFVQTTTTTNCLEADDAYHDRYYAEQSSIYTLGTDYIIQIYETAYIFVNNEEKRIIRDNDINEYNDDNVELYRCKGSDCRAVEPFKSVTYVADINKRILKYDPHHEKYFFAYDRGRDIRCIFEDNKCTPNGDMKKHEFCVTYKGELILAPTGLKNRETGECYRAESINTYIYGFSRHLYYMNQFAAQLVDQTGYYMVNLYTNSTVESETYLSRNSEMVMYGCLGSSCQLYEPDEDTYYYDGYAKTISKYKDGKWSQPTISGYAYVSVDPSRSYIYKFMRNKKGEIKIQGKGNYGYHYTIDQAMYYCDPPKDKHRRKTINNSKDKYKNSDSDNSSDNSSDNGSNSGSDRGRNSDKDKDSDCYPIDETGYYLTNAGEIYYCVHDSEELEATECTKQLCTAGQYYYMDETYYRCDSRSKFVRVISQYCSYDEIVVINFPLALNEELPGNVKRAIRNIHRNNNGSAVTRRRGRNYMESVSGIFTNCTYNVEETSSAFDLVCMNNYVVMDRETDEVKICSVEQYGYVECIENEDNPKKCNISSSAKYLIRPSLTLVLSFILLLFLYL